MTATLGRSTFDDLATRHRRELHLHCYRMLASFEEAEDAVQETFLRAWRARDTFSDVAGRSARAWLYRIATNVCLDQLRQRGRRGVELRSFAEVPWLQPYPDHLLDELGTRPDQPDAQVVSRETVELAFLAALQVLPPRQRAALILRDVLGTPAAETAAALDSSVAAANSALQRARTTMAEHLPSHRHDWAPARPSADERALLDRFIDAHERCDATAAMAIATQDLRVTMPPQPMCFEGLVGVRPLMVDAFGPGRAGDWRLVPVRANRMPAAASYLRAWDDTRFRAFKFDLLRVEDGAVAEITTFDSTLFGTFGLPAVLPDEP